MTTRVQNIYTCIMHYYLASYKDSSTAKTQGVMSHEAPRGSQLFRITSMALGITVGINESSRDS